MLQFILVVLRITMLACLHLGTPRCAWARAAGAACVHGGAAWL